MRTLIPCDRHLNFHTLSDEVDINTETFPKMLHEFEHKEDVRKDNTKSSHQRIKTKAKIDLQEFVVPHLERPVYLCMSQDP